VSGQEDKSETPREDAGDVEKEMTEGWRIGFWKGELAVIEALLDADPRNCMSTKLLSRIISCPLGFSCDRSKN